MFTISNFEREYPNQDLLLSDVKIVCLTYKGKDAATYYERYAKALDAGASLSALTEYDFSIFHLVARFFVNSGQIDVTRTLVKRFEQLESSTADDFKSHFALVWFWKVVIAQRAGSEVEAKAYSEQALAFIAKMRSSSTQQSLKEWLNDFESYFKRALLGSAPIRRVDPKIGRNEYVRVKDGKGNVSTVKFKKAEADIVGGKLELLGRA